MAGGDHDAVTTAESAEDWENASEVERVFAQLREDGQMRIGISNFTPLANNTTHGELPHVIYIMSGAKRYSGNWFDEVSIVPSSRWEVIIRDELMKS